MICWGSLIDPLQLSQLVEQPAPGQPLEAPVLRRRWRKTAVQRLVARKRHVVEQIKKKCSECSKVQWCNGGKFPSWARPAGKHNLKQWNRALNSQARKAGPFNFLANQVSAHVLNALSCLVTCPSDGARLAPPLEPAGERPPPQPPAVRA